MAEKSNIEKMAGLETQPSIPAVRHVMQFFEYKHLPEKLQIISAPFGDLAKSMEAALPNNPEKTTALRKLLEAKDAAVRALVCK